MCLWPYRGSPVLAYEPAERVLDSAMEHPADQRSFLGVQVDSRPIRSGDRNLKRSTPLRTQMPTQLTPTEPKLAT